MTKHPERRDRSHIATCLCSRSPARESHLASVPTATATLSPASPASSPASGIHSTAEIRPSSGPSAGLTVTLPPPPATGATASTDRAATATARARARGARGGSTAGSSSHPSLSPGPTAARSSEADVRRATSAR
uniref:Uncharacterized protein n=1 Tax=Oryza glumipatula TaxID=40148 RepID=A0A0E0A3A2_9ORYZ